VPAIRTLHGIGVELRLFLRWCVRVFHSFSVNFAANVTSSSEFVKQTYVTAPAPSPKLFAMTTAPFRIRSAAPADVPQILQLIRDLATYERAPNDVVASEAGLLEVLFGPRPAAEVRLAFENETAVGFAVFFHNFSTWLGRPGLYLEDLFVNKEHRGKGYGRALLVDLAGIARERGCGRMEWAVLDWNDPAIQFYKKLGAKPMNEWTVFRLTREGIEQLAAQ
jgi:GNAT superfamily N-acetyltransferase